MNATFCSCPFAIEALRSDQMGLLLSLRVLSLRALATHWRRVALSTLLLAALILAACAKKHHTVAKPAPARVPSDIQNGETGLASWYGHPYHGRPAADGEIYDMESLTAAHRTLPFGAWVRVTNLGNQ